MAEVTRYFASKMTHYVLKLYREKLKNALEYKEYLSEEGNAIVNQYEKNIENYQDLLNQAANSVEFFNEMNDSLLFEYLKTCQKLNRIFELGVTEIEDITKILDASEEIYNQIKSLQQEMADYMNLTGGQMPSANQMKIMNALMGNYNNAVIKKGKLTVFDYVKNGTISTNFEEAQDAVGNYQVNLHSGIDVVGGDLISPFYMNVIDGTESGSNGKTFSIIGTELKMRVLHGDTGSLTKSKDFYKPGDKIMPFPKKNNFKAASTGPHFHIELASEGKYINPFTLKTSDNEFRITLNGGRSWDVIKPNF